MVPALAEEVTHDSALPRPSCLLPGARTSMLGTGRLVMPVTPVLQAASSCRRPTFTDLIRALVMART